MCPVETPEPADSGEMGFDAVLRRVHDPLLAAIFWLALGGVLGWPDEVRIAPRHAHEGRSGGDITGGARYGSALLHSPWG
jgi:hypothetical protein